MSVMNDLPRNVRADPQVVTINGGVLGQNVTGVQRYAREIINALADLALIEPALSLHALIQGSSPVIGLDPTVRVSSSIWLPRPIWTQLVLPWLARGPLLSLGNIGPLGYANQILCVHDANIYLAPDSYSASFRRYYRAMLPMLGRRAQQITTVSNFSATMLDKFGVAPRKKISVIPNGREHVFNWDAARSKFASAKAFRRPFVFALGSRARHKNIAAVKAVAARLDELSLDLVIAGGTGTYFADVSEGASDPNVIHLGPVSDDDLAALYNQALCFVFPSVTEGFGLPALEAMALGCPVIATTAASLPEVCSDAALYADPFKPEEWGAKIEVLARSNTARNHYKAAGLARSQLYSWRSSADSYKQLLLGLT